MTRIYYVKEINSDRVKLVEASSQAQALSYVSKEAFECRVASQKDIISALTGGSIVEKAIGEPKEFVGDRITVPVTAHTRMISKSTVRSEGLLAEATEEVAEVENV